MKLKTYNITIPTTGYIIVEVKGEDEDDARQNAIDGKSTIIEECNGDWHNSGEDWEIEEVEE
jgi:hypothetical protein